MGGGGGGAGGHFFGENKNVSTYSFSLAIGSLTKNKTSPQFAFYFYLRTQA